MSCFIAMAEAMANVDESLRYGYVTDVKSTVYLAFGLIQVQAGWQTQLETDRTQAVVSSMEPGGAGLASVWNFKYQEDTQSKDTQTGQWQSILKSNQDGIDSDSDQRKANFSLASGMGAVLATINALITQF